MNLSLNFLRGSMLASDGTVQIHWRIFSSEFDDSWANNWAIKCTLLSGRWSKNKNDRENGYGRTYDLCELLWKLKVWKP